MTRGNIHPFEKHFLKYWTPNLFTIFHDSGDMSLCIICIIYMIIDSIIEYADKEKSDSSTSRMREIQKPENPNYLYDFIKHQRKFHG